MWVGCCGERERERAFFALIQTHLSVRWIERRSIVVEEESQHDTRCKPASKMQMRESEIGGDDADA